MSRAKELRLLLAEREKLMKEIVAETPTYEYAGFRFSVEVVDGRINMKACPGQHSAAYKERHRMNAISQYCEEKGIPQ